LTQSFLPCDQVPDTNTIRHDAKKYDENQGEEGLSSPDVERHNRLAREFSLPDPEEYEEEN